SVIEVCRQNRKRNLSLMTSATKKPENTSAGKADSRFRPDIQGLRAVAVGLVLLYHAGITWIPGGFVGVDVFFVISGFLITGMLVRQSLKRGQIDLADFYARRIRRILPAATVVLIFVAVVTRSEEHTSELQSRF